MREKLITDLGRFFNVPSDELRRDGITLSDIIEKSENAVNSVDLMEGFAEVIQDNELDEKIDIPVFSLQDRLHDVIESLVQQLPEG